jgi:putative sigma-54 modulation protein
MQVNITFRGMDSTDALKSHTTERVEHVNRYLDRASEAHVVLSLERYLHHADITIHAGPYVLRGRTKTDDMYKSIDEAMDKIERQLRRYKDKLLTLKTRHHAHHNQDAQDHVRVRHDILELAGPEAVEGALWAEGPKVIRSDELLAKPMKVDEAVMQMDLMNSDFLVYTNIESGQVNVVYRRKDGHFGLIEAPPSLPPTVARPVVEERA